MEEDDNDRNKTVTTQIFAQEPLALTTNIMIVLFEHGCECKRMAPAKPNVALILMTGLSCWEEVAHCSNKSKSVRLLVSMHACDIARITLSICKKCLRSEAIWGEVRNLEVNRRIYSQICIVNISHSQFAQKFMANLNLTVTKTMVDVNVIPLICWIIKWTWNPSLVLMLQN